MHIALHILQQDLENVHFNADRFLSMLTDASNYKKEVRISLLVVVHFDCMAVLHSFHEPVINELEYPEDCNTISRGGANQLDNIQCSVTGQCLKWRSKLFIFKRIRRGL